MDLNRNFDFNWATYVSSVKGTSAFSELETQAVRDFVLANGTNIVYLNDAHSAMTIPPG